MDILEVLATNLRRFRKEAGLSQEALAHKSNLHRTYIGGIEQMRINVSTLNLQKIASQLGIEAWQLLKPGIEEKSDSAKETKKTSSTLDRFK